MDYASICRKTDYLSEAPETFRAIWSRQSALDHFIKSNRTALVAAGAIVKISREWFVVIDVFPDVAAQILGLPVAETQS